MQALLRSSPQRVAGVVVAVSLLGVGLIPLFGGPGYEQSLASGLIVPSVAAVATAWELSAADAQELSLDPLACLGRGIASGLALGGIAFGTALLHAARVGMCDLKGGAVSFGLTALFGAVLGGAWGAVVAELARGRKRRRAVSVGLGVGLPLASALVSLARFYTSPMIFAFDPFVGYFSGTLYDTVIDAGTPLITYRVGSLASLACVTFSASLLTRVAARDAGRGRRSGLRLVALRGGGRATFARVRLALGAVSLGVSLLITGSGPTLGHWETSETIARELGGEAHGARCDVIHPASLLPREAALLVKDCDEQLLAVERTLGARGPERIRAFFFRDSSEKKRLMGAADTLIAKPWRQEVYVQLATYPHPVLGHELAHVVAGSFGRGPFHIAGSAGGLWPDPGLIEGTAVAASPDDEELSDAQWAHAMLDLGTLPPIRKLFSLGFLGVAASKSYTLAGAFVGFVLDTYGNGAVRAWYGGASLETLTGKTWETLDSDFHAYVAKTTLSPEAQSFARARFERAAVFGRKCPHVVDALRRKADLCRDAHEAGRATNLYREVLAHDPHDWGASYGLGVVNLRYGDEAEGARVLQSLAVEEGTPRTWRDRSEDALADGEYVRGEAALARPTYERLAARSLDEDFARTEDVKAMAVADLDGGYAPVMALLLGEPGRPADSVVAALRVGGWEAKSHSALASYLEGRAVVGREWFAAAAPELDLAIAGAASLTPRVGRESIRLRGVVACALGDGPAIDRTTQLVRDASGPYAGSSGRRRSTLRFLERCSRVTAAAPGLSAP